MIVPDPLARTDRAGLGLAIAALGILGGGGLVLAWDGAWFVLHAAQTGRPTFLHGRVIGWVLQAPELLARTVVHDPRVLAAIVGLSLAAMPAIALLASWRIVRPDRPELLAFPMVGIGLGLMAGQAFLVSEAIIVAALAWPLVLGAALGRLGRHRVSASLFVVAIAVAHPFAIPIFGVVAATSALVAVRGQGPERRAAAIVAGLIAIAVGILVLRYLLLASSYEVDALSLDRVLSQYRGSIAGRPLVAIGGAILLAAWLALRPCADRLGVVVAIAIVAAVTVVMVGWAADVERWQRALMFRTFAVLVELPIYGLAVLAALRPRPRNVPALSKVVVPAVGLAMVAVYAVQTWAWRDTLDDLDAALRSVPPGCVEADGALAETVRNTPLDHWGLTALVLVEESPTPAHLVVDGTTCASIDAGGGVPIKLQDGVVTDRIPARGWLDLSGVDGATGSHP